MHLLKKLFMGLAVMALLTVFLFPDAASAEGCRDWVAKAVSVQGSVQYSASDGREWTTVQTDNTFCKGDMVRVQERSRAAVLLSNKTVIRLDQNTTLTFSDIENKKISLLEIIKGIVHFISRTPMTLKVSTPFVNGTVEGTEFLVKVFDDHSMIMVLEGKVAAENRQGRLMLASGESAMASEGKAPVLRVDLRPADAVQWALYYPLIIEHPEGISSDAGESLSLVNNAAKLLSVGRVDEAEINIEKALKIAPASSSALSLRSIIHVAKNEKKEALAIAQRAVDADPDSVTARIALSYAQQAGFDLKGALMTLEKAVKVNPENSLALARLSEIQFSLGDLDKALESAEKAVNLNPALSRTQTIVGFIRLAQIKTQQAVKSFNEAIKLDQADPLPRLGLGLAKIRSGQLEDGREEIEIAASLDPGNSLVRSYLGKAYYEEKRDKLAYDQFIMAKGLDPLDPTPFFYNAIYNQSKNGPVAALNDLQKSIELNDNRAIYRSKLFLDEDLAARSVSLARIYNDLGFQQLALVEGWKSVNTDPGNYSAHRFLADSYSALPRHEIARVSELLQSQLLQPINITPIQPQLAESNLFILSGAGPGSLSLNEYNPLFNRNRFSLQVSGVVGENSTFGNDVVISGINDNISISAGQFHYESDGFRENNDLRQDIYNVFVQASPTYDTSIQAEYRNKETDKGDLSLNFDPSNFMPAQREDERSESIRFGVRHSISPHSKIIASFIYSNLDEHFMIPPVIDIDSDERGALAEAQYLFGSERINVIAGAGHFKSKTKETTATLLIIDPDMPPISSSETVKFDIRHNNLYLYSLVHCPKDITFTIAGSADIFEGGIVDRNQFNPKLGIAWNPNSASTVRAAVFRTLKRSLVSEQTVEPTQVAGFNQFFDNANATDSWHYGAAIDHKFSKNVFVGIEMTRREMDVPFEDISIPFPPAPPVPVINIMEADWRDDMMRSYVYWTPLSWLAVRGEYSYEELIRQDLFVGNIERLKTHRVPMGLNIFSSSGFSAGLTATLVNQEGVFFDQFLMTTSKDSDRFWVVDASVGYRLPERLGVLSIEARNLFDEEFRFQDTDPANPDIYTERYILGKFTFAF